MQQQSSQISWHVIIMVNYGFHPCSLMAQPPQACTNSTIEAHIHKLQETRTMLIGYLQQVQMH